MGGGLAGAIGAAMAWPEKRAILIEGDGSFIHTSQELGTIAVNRLNLKLFVLANEGYAAYFGCDRRSGVSVCPAGRSSSTPTGFRFSNSNQNA